MNARIALGTLALTLALASCGTQNAAAPSADTATDAVPFAGSVVDMLFPGHLMAAKALQKDIEARHGLPDDIALERSRKKRGLFRKKGG